MAYIDADQPLYKKLLLWHDRNHNGVSERDELSPLSTTVSTIGLSYRPHSRRDEHGNLFAFRGWVWVRSAPGKNFRVDRADDDARRRMMYDVILKAVR